MPKLKDIKNIVYMSMMLAALALATPAFCDAGFNYSGDSAKSTAAPTAADSAPKEQPAPDSSGFKKSDPSDPSASSDAGNILMLVGKFDLDNGVLFTWWSDEVWASFAYKDKTPDAVAGYAMTSIVGKDYVLFSPVASQGEPPKVNGASKLANSDGVTVTSAPVHASFTDMIPGLIAFPRRDASGKDILDPKTKGFKVTVQYDGKADPTEYNWSLPIHYPDEIKDAYAWLKSLKNKKIEDMSEDEAVMALLMPYMKVDIGSGLMVAPMTPEFLKFFMNKDPEIKENTIVKAVAGQILDKYKFFIVITLDMAKNHDRVQSIVDTGKLTLADGKTVAQDKDAEKSFLGSMSNVTSDPFMLMIFPGSGKTTDKETLKFKNPENEAEIQLKW